MQPPGLLCQEQLLRRAFLGHRGGQAGCRGHRDRRRALVMSVLCIFLTGEIQRQSFARRHHKAEEAIHLPLVLSSACCLQVLSTSPALSRTGSAGTLHLAHPLNGIPALQHLPGTARGPLLSLSLCCSSAANPAPLPPPLPPSFKVLLNYCIMPWLD